MRYDDGLLFLEIEGATEDQLRSGLSAARSYIVRSGVMIEDAMEAFATREQELAWERGQGEPSNYDDDLAEIADEAFMAALEAVGAGAGTWGLVEPEGAPVRDLFECMA